MERKHGPTLRSLALHALLILLLVVVAENLYVIAIMSTTYTHSKGMEAMMLSRRKDETNPGDPSRMADDLRASTVSLGYRVIALSIIKAVVFIAGGLYLTWRAGSALARIETGLSRLAEGGEDVALGSGGPEELRRVTERFNHLSANLAAARRDLIRSSRLSTAGELAALLAHEIKNPLAGASLAVDALESRVIGPGAMDAIGDIRDSISRVDSVVRDLLDMTRPTVFEPRQVEINELMHDSARMTRRFAEARGVDLDILQASQGATLETDPGMARQVLVNLLMNAVKATPRGPSAGKVEIGGIGQDEETGWRIWVKDAGPGYPGGEGPLQADPFVSGFSEGTGLGLAVVSRLADILGWAVSIETPPSGGTVFSITAQKTAL